MALVANYDSDPEISDNEQAAPQILTTTATTTLSSSPVKLASSSPFGFSVSANPPPSTAHPVNKSSGPKKIYIELPKVTSVSDDEDIDEQEPAMKKSRLSGGKGLFGMLPEPKNSIKKSSGSSPGNAPRGKATTEFMPYSLSKKKTTEEKKIMGKNSENIQENDNQTTVSMNAKNDYLSKDNTNIMDDEYDEDVVPTSTSSDIKSSFFSFGSDLINTSTASKYSDSMTVFEESSGDDNTLELASSTKLVGPTMTAADLYNPNNYYHYGNQMAEAYGYEEDEDQSNDENEAKTLINEEILAKLGGRHRGDEPINVIEVKQAEQIKKDPWTMDPTSSTASTSLVGGSFKPTTMQKRKHNLFSLVAQAKDMNEKLQESYTQQRVAKRQSQQRYGH